MLSIPWEKRQGTYEFVVIGSGYGGAITSARISAALNRPHALCILERGKEWVPGTFPRSVPEVLNQARSSLNPLGLYEFLNYKDISVIKGSGLGGTSLINANVAIVPDAEVFRLGRLAAQHALRRHAGLVLRARAECSPPVPCPAPPSLLQGQGARAARRRTRPPSPNALNIAVNFNIDGPNAHGVCSAPASNAATVSRAATSAAKNTLYMNYLPMARSNGADIFTQTKVEWIEKLSTRRLAHPWAARHVDQMRTHESFTLDAANVILSAGSINSTEILLRSEMHGLKVSPALGTGFSGNGDFFGLSYNGALETDVLGYGQRQPAARTARSARARPSSASSATTAAAPVEKRIAIEDFSFPSAYVAARQDRLRRHSRRRHAHRRRGRAAPARPHRSRPRPAVRPRRRAEPHHALPGHGAATTPAAP